MFGYLVFFSRIHFVLLSLPLWKKYQSLPLIKIHSYNMPMLPLGWYLSHVGLCNCSYSSFNIFLHSVRLSVSLSVLHQDQNTYLGRKTLTINGTTVQYPEMVMHLETLILMMA